MIIAAKLVRLTPEIAITTAPSGRELYHLQFSLHVANTETSGYNVVHATHIQPSTS